MPVSTGATAEPRPKRCKHCDESTHRLEPIGSTTSSGSSSGYWHIQLDRDLVDAIAAIYPEWVRAPGPPASAPSAPQGTGAGGLTAMAEGGVAPQAPASRTVQAAPVVPAGGAGSPPKAIVDSSPLINTMEQNKQSLKVKLMLRRPINQLIAQGIMPPLKTPPAFHDQRRQLERAKTGDMLKAKIQQRPARHELERRHILEAEPAVDPSLAERQRMLKKARLADQLNDQLSHRPGPLELIQKNILHTEEPIEEAVKAGRIPFRATCEGQINKPQHPLSYVTFDEDSQSSEGDGSSPRPPGSAGLIGPPPPAELQRPPELQREPQQQQQQQRPADVLEAAAKSAGIVVSLAIPASEGNTLNTVVVTSSSPVVFADLCRSAPALLPLTTVPPSPASLVSSTSTLSPLSSVGVASPQAPPTPAPLAVRAVPSPAPGKDKNRKKSKCKTAPKTRTIKFHEYKGPPNAQKNAALAGGTAGETSYELLLKQQQLFLQWQLQLQHKYPQIILPAAQKASQGSDASSVTSSTSVSTSARLEDMKVSDLKAELKRRNLPVSGSKPQLIERLKPFTSGDTSDLPAPRSVCSEESLGDGDESGSPRSLDDDREMEVCEAPSPQAPTSEDIVREQQKQIEELQRKLTLSQMQLQQVAAQATTNPRPESKAQRLALQQHIQARRQHQQMALQVQQIQALQQLQQAEQERQQQLQQQHVVFQNTKNLANGLLLNGADATLVLNHLVQGKVKLVNGQGHRNSLPNFLGAIPLVPATVISTTPTPIKTEEVKPPPVYEEATKQIKKEKNNVKSQIVDDVLEILIKNGELPPSAAQEPTTPSSAGVRATEPVFTPAQTQENIEPPAGDDVFSLDNSDLRELGLYMDSMDNLDFSQLDMDIGMSAVNGNDYDGLSIPMDTDDSDWLDSLLPAEPTQQPVVHFDTEMSTYDPLLGNAHDPFDLFSLDEFKEPVLTWDKIDFAA